MALLNILPYVDGVRHVRRIAFEAEVDLDVVIRCVEALLFAKVAVLIDVFQYSNVYSARPELRRLARSVPLMRACIRYIVVPAHRANPPPVSLVFALYCACEPSRSIGEFCTEHEALGDVIDPRRFVAFGVAHGLLRRVHLYPHHTRVGEEEPTALAAAALPLVTGERHYDELCTELSCSLADLRAALRATGTLCEIARR
jgi:hypothetical protein